MMAGIVQTSPNFVAAGERYTPSVNFFHANSNFAIGVGATASFQDAPPQTITLAGPTEDVLFENWIALWGPNDTSGQLQVLSCEPFLFLSGLGGFTSIPFPLFPATISAIAPAVVGFTGQFLGLTPKRYSWRDFQQFLSAFGPTSVHGPILVNTLVNWTFKNNDGANSHNVNTQFSGTMRKIEGTEVD